ncbi:MAG: DUF1353 domain-containing protein [Gallionella sp.]|nr:DUF1353 domain-containing protein [Gallionella sp.]MDD4958017.1 DUF1353 domain-containing protein [Gallionella sp.]
MAIAIISKQQTMENVMGFSGNPKTEWLPNPGGCNRDMKLLEDFWFDDPKGRRWLAPKNSVVNGASIPQALWSTVGSPYTDNYRRASIVHDVACNDLAVRRDDADEMFYYACLDGGCSLLQAKMLYAGVRIGAWACIGGLQLMAVPIVGQLYRLPSQHTNDEYSGPRISDSELRW